MLSNLLVSLPFMVGALATSMRPRSSKTDLTFYAYGSEGSAGIGGYPIVFRDELAYIAKSSYSSSTQNVTFDYSVETLVATIEGGLQRLLYLPSPSGAVGFSTTGTSNSSEITYGFGFYGSTVFCYVDNDINTRWFAEPTDEAGLWNLSWNSTSDSAIAVALRTIAPTS